MWREDTSQVGTISSSSTQATIWVKDLLGDGPLFLAGIQFRVSRIGMLPFGIMARQILRHSHEIHSRGYIDGDVAGVHSLEATTIAATPSRHSWWAGD